MTKAEWITDFIVQPGIIQGADYLQDMSAFYLVEINGKKLLVKVSQDFITTSELAEDIDTKKFEIGNYKYKRAAYQIK